MSAQRKARNELTKLMAASALIATQTTEDSDPFWAAVEESLARMERPQKEREPIVRGRSD